MLIEVGDLRRQKGNEKNFAGSVSRFEIELRGDSLAFNDVLVDGWATNVGGGIYIKGSITAKANLICSCCLTQFTIPIDASFEETFYAQGSDIGDADDSGQFYSGEQIDLGDVIIEGLLLSLPMKPVCHPDCRGLCPSCGCNLNEVQCGCHQEALDPRLAGLSKYLKSMQAADAQETGTRDQESE